MSGSLENYLELMWTDYCKMNPQAREIYNLFTAQGEIITNDHIALRTLKHPRLGIKSLAQHFLKYGYFEAGEYFFVEKKLYAKHYENKNPEMPKIFISELELEKMPPFVQSKMEQIITAIPDSEIAQESFVYKGKYWDTDYETYLKLAKESEYASWVYAWGFRPNHFTVNVNDLRSFESVEQINEFIKKNGHRLNSSGGEIKGTPLELLEQSSTMASEIEVTFLDGKHAIPGCYYEFARRYPMSNGKNYQGFIAKSADKIFESTNKI